MLHSAAHAISRAGPDENGGKRAAANVVRKRESVGDMEGREKRQRKRSCFSSTMGAEGEMCAERVERDVRVSAAWLL